MHRLIILCFVTFSVLSCKKEGGPQPTAAVAALNIVNVISESDVLIADINNQLADFISVNNNGLGIYPNSATPFGFPGGTKSLSLRQISDTMNTVYNNASLELPGNSVHSLFMTGTTAAPESVLTSDTIPDLMTIAHGSTDSLTGFRFINLSTGSMPVSVNIAGNSTAEVASLNYKDYTSFKSYPAGGDFYINGYTFEFHDASTGDLLATYSTANFFYPPVPLYKNITIVLYGAPGSQSTMSVNSF